MFIAHDQRHAEYQNESDRPVTQWAVRLCRRMCGGGYAPPIAARLFPGYAPGSGLALRTYCAKGPTKGIAQKCKRQLYGGA